MAFSRSFTSCGSVGVPASIFIQVVTTKQEWNFGQIQMKSHYLCRGTDPNLYGVVGTLNEFTMHWFQSKSLSAVSFTKLNLTEMQQQSDHATSMSRCVDISTGQRTVKVVFPVIEIIEIDYIPNLRCLRLPDGSHPSQLHKSPITVSNQSQPRHMEFDRKSAPISGN
jgi:hypothetical protein